MSGLPMIAGVEITTDDRGRFNLNALHRASGGEAHKKPSQWLRRDEAQALIVALGEQSPDLHLAPIDTSHGGKTPGTFAAEQLAVAYANWISPQFYLTVIQTFLDYKSGKLRPLDPTAVSRSDLARMVIESETERERLAAENAVMAPKVEALERLTRADGSLCITNAAKDLQVRPKDLFAWLQAHRWIYRRTGGGWVAYQTRLQQGVLEHKVTTVERTDGSSKTVEQVRITAKGLAHLAEALGRAAA